MNKLIVAIDTNTLEHAWHLMRHTATYCGMFKFGSEAFTACGPRVTSFMDKPFFLDLKYHDIPSTVAKAVTAALPLKPYMLSVHASGGIDMISAAREAAEKSGKERPLIIAATVLTSTPYADEAQDLAIGAVCAGADGVVCGGWELADFRKVLGPDIKLIVPGIRSTIMPGDDQVRTLPAKRAIEEGADWIVVGRPITASGDPGAAAKAMMEEIQ